MLFRCEGDLEMNHFRVYFALVALALMWSATLDAAELKVHSDSDGSDAFFPVLQGSSATARLLAENITPVSPSFISVSEESEPGEISAAPEAIDPELQWKRAIDRDDAKVLWEMLSDVNVAITNDKGKTALMAAVKLGDKKLVEKLLLKGLSLNDRSRTGGTVLMYATLGNQHDMIHYLLQDSAAKDNLDAQSSNGWTAVMIAAAKGFDQAVKTLIEHGADAWLADAYQWSPLMRAIDNRHSNVVRYLLTLPDVPVNFQNENGSTALHIAVLSNDRESTKLLVARNAQRNMKDDNGMTAADIALANRSDELLSLIDTR